MDELITESRALMGFHADLVVQTAVWVSLWAVGLWVLRVRAGALRYVAWLIALGAIPLFPLVGWQSPRVIRVTDVVPVKTSPLSLYLFCVQGVVVLWSLQSLSYP